MQLYLFLATSYILCTMASLDALSGASSGSLLESGAEAGKAAWKATSASASAAEEAASAVEEAVELGAGWSAGTGGVETAIGAAATAGAATAGAALRASLATALSVGRPLNSAGALLYIVIPTAGALAAVALFCAKHRRARGQPGAVVPLHEIAARFREELLRQQQEQHQQQQQQQTVQERPLTFDLSQILLPRRGKQSP